MKTLLFHIGRGGRFNNQGHLTFVEVGGINRAPFILNQEYYYPIKGEDAEGNTIDDDSDSAELLDECGNGIGLTAGELRANEGKIDIDGDYNTWYTAHSDDLSEREARAILNHYKNDAAYIYEENVELLIEVAEEHDLHDELAEIFDTCTFSDMSHNAALNKANEWLSANDYDTIED